MSYSGNSEEEMTVLWGGLRVSDWRTLVVQMHGDGWGKTTLSMGICLSSSLLWPSHLWCEGTDCPLASTGSLKLSS